MGMWLGCFGCQLQKAHRCSVKKWAMLLFPFISTNLLCDVVHDLAAVEENLKVVMGFEEIFELQKVFQGMKGHRLRRKEHWELSAAMTTTT